MNRSTIPYSILEERRRLNKYIENATNECEKEIYRKIRDMKIPYDKLEAILETSEELIEKKEKQKKIKTTEDVKSYITQTENDIEDITNLRQKYRNKLRNCTDDKLIQEYKEKRNECTTILNKYRKNLKTANYILEDIPKVKEVIKIERKMKRLKKLDITKVKQKNKNLIR